MDKGGDRTEGFVGLWSMENDREIRSLPLDNGIVETLAFSCDGKRLATAGYDAIHVWDVTRGKENFILKGHAEKITGVIFSADGKVLASCSFDRTIRLWDLPSGREIRKLQGHTAWIYSVAFSPSGRTLISGSLDGTALLWNLAPESGKADDPGRLCDDLFGADPATAHAATPALIDAKNKTVALFKERLRPTTVPQEKIQKLIEELDAEEIAAREEAFKELEKMGVVAEHALRKALKATSSVELRWQVNDLLNTLPSSIRWTPETVPVLRAIPILERIRTPEAKALLEEIAKSIPPGSQVREAGAALDRWNGAEKKEK